MRHLPQTATGKIDRRKLRNLVQSISFENLRAYTLSSPEKGKLSTPMEAQLAMMWCQILSSISVESIVPNASFFRLGGDSVLAMHLAALARRKGYSVGFTSIFQNPKLSAQASVIQCLPSTRPHMDRTHARIAPFSLLTEAEQNSGNAHIVRNDLAKKNASDR